MSNVNMIKAKAYNDFITGYNECSNNYDKINFFATNIKTFNKMNFLNNIKRLIIPPEILEFYHNYKYDIEEMKNIKEIEKNNSVVNNLDIEKYNLFINGYPFNGSDDVKIQYILANFKTINEISNIFHLLDSKIKDRLQPIMDFYGSNFERIDRKKKTDEVIMNGMKLIDDYTQIGDDKKQKILYLQTFDEFNLSLLSKMKILQKNFSPEIQNKITEMLKLYLNNLPIPKNTEIDTLSVNNLKTGGSIKNKKSGYKKSKKSKTSKSKKTSKKGIKGGYKKSKTSKSKKTSKKGIKGGSKKSKKSKKSKTSKKSKRSKTKGRK